MNEYATEASLLASTDWIVPTKKTNTSSPAPAPKFRRSTQFQRHEGCLRRHHDRLLGSRREEELAAWRILAAAAGCHGGAVLGSERHQFRRRVLGSTNNNFRASMRRASSTVGRGSVHLLERVADRRPSTVVNLLVASIQRGRPRTQGCR
jgi:hypothetical protein